MVYNLEELSVGTSSIYDSAQEHNVIVTAWSEWHWFLYYCVLHIYKYIFLNQIST